ncbi:hypothetical protein [Pantoea ananatis]|uniref:hypothetical protein n=1 Tax=Pantoea ananas TaxID=553 RepID=UPI001EE4FF50|nr:hypothetical protein [Pantoea ananatis]
MAGILSFWELMRDKPEFLSESLVVDSIKVEAQSAVTNWASVCGLSLPGPTNEAMLAKQLKSASGFLRPCLFTLLQIVSVGRVNKMAHYHANDGIFPRCSSAGKKTGKLQIVD